VEAEETMQPSNAESKTTKIFLDLLKRTEKAHGLHEKEIGKPDPDWPEWYAQYMTRELGEAGYRIGTTTPSTEREPQLLGQTVVVIGGSAGIGLETARRARAEGAKLILTGRNPERLRQAASELDALGTAAFDAMDPPSVERFFRDLPAPIDHVLLTAGRPTYGRLVDMDLADVRRALDEHLLMAIQVARQAAKKVRPSGTLLLMGGTGARRPGIGLGIASTVTDAMPPLTASLAIELAPMRVNLIAAGFVDTPLSASLLGDELEDRRKQLRSTLPIRRVVGPADVASLAVHIMINTALTGATYDVDGGQQFVTA
jgi:NAD(P)-dependent dehydrogenase (short-subunit alcohol dehydrogenase family)